MIKNGLYSLTAVAIDGVDVEVGGVLMLRDGKLQGGDSYVFYTGTYACVTSLCALNNMPGMTRRDHCPPP